MPDDPLAQPKAIADFPRMIPWIAGGASWSVYVEAGPQYRLVIDGGEYRVVTTVNREGLEGIIGMMRSVLDQPTSNLVVPDLDLDALRTVGGLPPSPSMNRAQRRAAK